MKKSIYAILALSVLFASCDSWVENAETPSNTLTRDQLNKSAMVANIQSNSITDGPLVAYVKTLQGDASAAAFLALGTTVDELTEGTIPNALLYRQIATDNLTPTSGTQNDLWNKIHNYYARSIELTEIAGQITGANAEQTEIVKAYGNYVGHLHAGYALQLLAESFSGIGNHLILRLAQVVVAEPCSNPRRISAVRSPRKARKIRRNSAICARVGAVDS